MAGVTVPVLLGVIPVAELGVTVAELELFPDVLALLEVQPARRNPTNASAKIIRTKSPKGYVNGGN